MYSAQPPPLPSSIWALIFTFVPYTDLDDLNEYTMISKPIRRYCYDSIAYKANQLIRYSDGCPIRAVEYLLQEGYYKNQDSVSLIDYIITNLNNQLEEKRADMNWWYGQISWLFDNPPVGHKINKTELVRVLNKAFDPPEPNGDLSFMLWYLSIALQDGDLNLALALLRLTDIKGVKDDAEVRKVVRQQIIIGSSFLHCLMSNRHHHLEFLCDEMVLGEDDLPLALSWAVKYGFNDFATRIRALQTSDCLT
ncbi:hypothetical protein HDV05_002267 [Chytridiales sp. JEL 0842]|nr:hypothetical protein HDV05_002267 [Chytridiales sp. JEL 0842]